MGKTNSRKCYWNLDGKKYQIGNVCSFIEKQGLCKYSHNPMTVNQELLLDTKHVQEQRSDITWNMFGSVHKRHRQDHTPTTTKRVGALLWCHLGHQGTSMGPGTDTHGTPMPEREGRGWPATRSTVRQTCTTKRQTTVFTDVQDSGAFSVQSAQPGPAANRTSTSWRS